MFQHLKNIMHTLNKENSKTNPSSSSNVSASIRPLPKEATYLKENTDGVTSTYGVFVLLQILFECIRVTSLYDLHAHMVQGLDRFMNGTVFLIIVCIAKPDMRTGLT
jgi:hypothetical protein